MANSKILLGDVDLATVLADNPGHGLDAWVIESYLAGNTLRIKRNQADAMRVIFCKAWHALDPRGVQSEKDCSNRTISATCLHGEQWASGLGIIRQFVQSSSGLRLATPEEVMVITQAQNDLGICDTMAHANAPDVREGLIQLGFIEAAVKRRQEPIGERVIRTRNQVSARVAPHLDTPYDTWLANRA